MTLPKTFPYFLVGLGLMICGWPLATTYGLDNVLLGYLVAGSGFILVVYAVIRQKLVQRRPKSTEDDHPKVDNS